MEFQDRKLLEEALALSRENNRILVKLRRAQIFGRAAKAVYWVVVVGVALGAFYFLQPYLEALEGAADGVIRVFESPGDAVGGE